MKLKQKAFWLLLLIMLLLNACELDGKSGFLTDDEPNTRPTPERIVENEIIHQGRVTLVSSLDDQHADGSYVDLDNNSEVFAEADIEFAGSIGSSSFFTLVPLNGSSAKSMGAESIDINECNTAIHNFGTTNIPELFKGNQICVLTRIGNVSVVEIVGGVQNGIILEFSTWTGKEYP